MVVLFSLGIPNYFFLSLNTAAAANNYIEDIKFYENSDGLEEISFKVKTSFDITIGAELEPDNYNTSYCSIGGGYFGSQKNPPGDGINPRNFQFVLYGDNYSFECNTTQHYVAGQTYKGILTVGMRINHTTKKICVLDNCAPVLNCDIKTYLSSYGTPTSNTYITLTSSLPGQWAPLYDTEKYYFTEYPSLTTTWPENDNIEIAGDFNITGTITQPSPYEYNQLMTYAYLYNPLGEYDPIGVFTIPLLATSTQQFTQPIIGLPVSNPRNIVLINELQKLEGDIITETYRKDGGTEFPWLIRIKTFLEGEAPSYPFEPPEWDNYLDIYRPSASSDGYYRLKTPTSTIEFSYNFPETYKIRITENEIEKLATSTFASIDPDGNLRFEVANIDASTSTINWIEAKVYNTNDILIITARFPILGLEAGQEENLGIWGQIEDFIRKQTTALFLPSQTTIDKFQKSLPDIIKSKIPMSYFYEIKDIIQETNISTSTSDFPAVEVNLDGQEVELQLINFNWLEEQGYMTTLKNLMRVFLWATYFIYLFSIGTAGPKQLQFKF